MNLITNTENYFATVASNSKIDAMRFAMACMGSEAQWNENVR
ncbi:hypothetical protein [Vibrio alginolyticus]|nr:hypothetical protein [Vibrio alginolyticus]